MATANRHSRLSPPIPHQVWVTPTPRAWRRRACIATAGRAPRSRPRSFVACAPRASRKRTTYPETATEYGADFAEDFVQPFVQGNEARFEFKTRSFSGGT